MKPFDQWTYRDAAQAITKRKERSVGAEGYKANRALVEEHDFWQNGETWVGPRGSAAAWAAALREAIEKQHIPGAASLEALSNYARGEFGKEPLVQAVPAEPVAEGSEREDALTAEAEALIADLSAWWDDAGLWAKLRQAGIRSRWATWGTLRLRIRPGVLQEGENGAPQLPAFSSFAEALSAIEVSAPEPEHAIVLEHPDTGQRAALFTYEEGEQRQKRAELWYQDGEQTVFRILPEGGEVAEVDRYDWAGELPISEMDGELLLTEVVRRQEAALDFAETNVVKVGETAGFRERYTMNAEPNGIWTTAVPPGPGPHTQETDERGQTLYFHPVPRSMGPATTTDLVGRKVKSDQSGEQRANPGVHIADPVDPQFAITGAEYRRARVLQLCHQGHLAMIATGEASGFAYEQARAVFRGDLEWHKSPAEMALLRLLTALVRMADSMTSEPARVLERLRLVVTLTPDAGPISPELRAAVMQEVEKGLRSRESAMGMLGIEDVSAEMEAIQQDPAAQLGLLERRVGVLTLLMGANPDLSMVQAAIAVGWDEEEARKLFGEADAAAAQTRQGREEIAAALQRGREADPEREVA
ncbi:MAG TPA: hypothetical protein VFI96_01745 [Longimicrobiaceae bacterium]|nr:hypothetical protein [Longimicrobiaceae bacterium]